MRKPTKSLSETAYGMWLCNDKSGPRYSDCRKCPYCKCMDCVDILLSDAIFYLECYRRLVELANHPEQVAVLSTYCRHRSDDALSAEEFDRMYEEYMEDKKNAENHVL